MELRLGVEAGMKEGSQSRASVSPGRGGREGGTLPFELFGRIIMLVVEGVV